MPRRYCQKKTRRMICEKNGERGVKQDVSDEKPSRYSPRGLTYEKGEKTKGSHQKKNIRKAHLDSKTTTGIRREEKTPILKHLGERKRQPKIS